VNNVGTHHLLMVLNAPTEQGKKESAGWKKPSSLDWISSSTLGNHDWYASRSNRSVSSTT
jgi:hypothetical protein